MWPLVTPLWDSFLIGFNVGIVRKIIHASTCGSRALTLLDKEPSFTIHA